ncbi:MAG: hypothetical protein IPP71_21745 [Bacteroidetes bacterium]|nr:hypothetical protein [Bacteroidota bacterium]
MYRLAVGIGVVFLLTLNGCSPKSNPESKSAAPSWLVNGKLCYWRDTDTLKQKLNCNDRIFPTSYRILDSNYPELKKLLVKEGSTPGELAPDTIAIDIPMPDGSWEPFKINQVQVMAKELAAKYPDIKTYSGKSQIYPSDNIRLDISSKGVRVMILSTRGSIMIDPYCNNDEFHVISYFRKNLPENSKEDFERN